MSYYSSYSSSTTCDNGHSLVHTSPSKLIYTNYAYSHGYICNKCRTSFKNKYSYHCKYCEYDICIDCYGQKSKAKSYRSEKQNITDSLINMGFPSNYIQRAFKVYEKNYGHKYNVEVITEIIVRLQNKDKKKSANKKNTQTSTNQSKTCNKGHSLVYKTKAELVYTDYGYNYGYRCDKCSKSYGTHGSYHCKTCMYDLCNNCYSKNANKNNVNCPSHHGLKLFSVPNYTFACDGCRTKSRLHQQMYGCRRCNYDLCVSCHNNNNTNQTQSKSISYNSYSSPFQSAYAKQMVQATYSSNANIDEENTGSCTHVSCYCKQYIVSTSKWSQGKCKTCNHCKSLHGGSLKANASFYTPPHMSDNKTYHNTRQQKTKTKSDKKDWRSKKMHKWNNEDVLNWIYSIGLIWKWQKKVNDVIKTCECTGKDIVILKSAQDVGD
eukprot:156792_1